MNKDIIEIHSYDTRLKRILHNIEVSKEIPDADKILLKSYHDDLILDGLSLGRVIRYMHLLMQLSKWLKIGFEKATTEDIKKLISSIESSSHYKDWSKYLYKIGLRKFYKWLKKTDEYPEEVAWMKIRMKNGHNKLPEQMLTEEEIKKLIEVTRHPMERALVSVLYESGCRIGEILTLRIKNITFDEYGAQLIVDGKTGQRRVRIISAVPYLQEWLNKHIFKDDPDSWVWLNERKKVLKYNSALDLFIRLKKEAGIKKPVNPHNFRHSRATFLAKHLTERQLREFFGWKDFRMADVYVHLAGRDVDTALLKMYGIEVKENNNNESKLKPRNCPRCKEVNPVTNKFCSKCGMVIDEKTVIEIIERDTERKQADDILDKLLENEEFKLYFLQKIKELNLK